MIVVMRETPLETGEYATLVTGDTPGYPENGKNHGMNKNYNMKPNIVKLCFGLGGVIIGIWIAMMVHSYGCPCSVYNVKQVTHKVEKLFKH